MATRRSLVNIYCTLHPAHPSVLSLFPVLIATLAYPFCVDRKRLPLYTFAKVPSPTLIPFSPITVDQELARHLSIQRAHIFLLVVDSPRLRDPSQSTSRADSALWGGGGLAK